MKRLLFLCCFACLTIPAFAAGGTCPTGANYIDLTNPSNGGGLGSITLSTLGETSCYYISASGLDTNTGTDESHPWLHAPGMANCSSTCAGVTPTAGLGFIFRGGDTWHQHSGSPLTGAWAWNYSTGTSSNPIYFGVDFTWFSGGSFVRPIFNQDNPLSTTTVSSCSFAEDGNTFLTLSGSWIIADTLEFTGNCMSGSGDNSTIDPTGGADIVTERLYIHGWTMTSGVGDDGGVKIGTNANSTGNVSNRHLFDVIDGSDSTYGTNCNSSSCIGVGNSPPTHGATGWGFGDAYDVEYSFIQHLSNGIQAGEVCNLIGDTMQFIFEPSFGGRHGNVVEHNFGAGCTTGLIYNNLVLNTNTGVRWWLELGTGYIFNNVSIHSGHTFTEGTCGACDPDGLNLSGTGRTGFPVVHYYLYNNTFQTILSQAQAESSTTPGWGSGSTITFENNHIMDYTSSGAFFNCLGSNSCSETDNGGSKFMTTSVANTDGYVLANNYAPTSGSSPTVGTGNNVTSSFCSTLPNANAIAACEGATSTGVSEISAWGGKSASYPDITVNARPSSGAWDTGAYEFNAGVSFTASPTTLPAHHSSNIAVTLTGSGTSWTGSTAFSISGVSGATLVSKSNSSATSETLQITTGSGTGTLTITDTTDSISTTVAVATATLGLSPTTGATGTTPTLTLTGTNTLWLSETLSGLFTESGGSGASLSGCSVTTNTAATCTLTVGSATGTLTITDNSTTATASFTATASLACGGTASVVQHLYTTSCVGNGSNTTCTVTPSSTSGANHLGGIVAWFSGSSSSTSNGITSVSGNVNGTTGWTACPSHSCFASVGTIASGCASGFCSQDVYYNPNMTGGDTSFTVTLGNPPPTFFQVWYGEWSLPGTGGAFYDTSGSGTDATACTNCAGQALTLSDKQDIIIQTSNSSQECTAISPSTYSNPVDVVPTTEYGGVAAAQIDVTSAPTTPTYTCVSGTVPVSGLALAECTAALGTTVVNPAFSLTTGNYVGPQFEILSDPTPGATICYTTDGSTPAASTPGTCSHGTTYTVPFLLPQPTQTVQALGTLSGDTNSSVVSSGAINITNVAQLPAVQVDNNEAVDGTTTLTTYELNLGTQTWTVGPPPSCSFSVPYWTVGTPTLSGLQSAINDVEICRTHFGFASILDIPPALYTGAAGIYIPQSSSSLATQFNILRSTQDSNLPNGTTVCSHGIQDNLATSTDPGIDNPDCAGDVMTYQLGTTVTSISAGAFTLANGTATNTSNYDDVQYMWTLEGSGTTPTAMRFCSPVGGGSSSSLVPACTSSTLAPDHWLIEDGEFRIQAGDTTGSDIVAMAGSGSETATSQYPTHIHFRKDWAHGDWTSLVAGANSVSDGFNLICQYCSIVDSQVSEALRPGAEGHAFIFQGDTAKFNHNWFEGQSIGMITGGNCSPWPVSGYIPFQDVEIRRNRFTFPWSWLGVGTVPGGNTNWGGSGIARKNAGPELKSGQRDLITGNISENIDTSGGQGGVTDDFKTANDSCGFGTNYQNILTDVTDVSNIRRNGLETFELVRNPGTVGGVDQGTRRVSMSNDFWYNISETNFGGSENQGFQIQASGWAWQGTLTENANGSATFVANCSVDRGTCIGQIASVTISGCSGAGSWSASAPNLTGGTKATGSYNASCVATISNPGSGYTSAPTISPSTGSGTATINASSTTPPTGFTVLDIPPGDIAGVYGCSVVTSFNQPTTSYSSGFLPSGIGPVVLPGVNPLSLTTTYAWPTSTTPSGSSDTAGYCKITNMQSFPQALTVVHSTLVSNAAQAVAPSNGFGNFVTNGPNFQQNGLWRDSIILGGGLQNSSGIGSGTPVEKFNWDITTLSMDHLVWPTITASTMTEYGNNPAYPDSAGCTGAGCHPPTTMYYPATPYCTGSSPTSACVGFIGAMSASSMPLVLPDYHNFALIAGSSFKAGGSEQASDGTDMGVNMSAIDAAQTTNQYAAAGFFPDTLGTFSCTPATIPANHSGTIALTCTGVFTTWTSGTVFSASGCAFVSSSNTSATQETVNISTTSAGTCTITDTTDSVTAPITVGTAGLTISPTTGATSTTPTETLTCTGSPAPCLWLSETLSGLFTVSGGSGASLSGCSVTTNTAATCTLGTGTLPGTLTLEDQSTTATANFTVTGTPTSQQFRVGCPVGTTCPTGHFKITGGVIQ